MILKQNLTRFTCKNPLFKGLYCTKTAFLQINKIIKTKQNTIGIKIFLRKSGCLGFKYKITLIDNLSELSPNEIVFKKEKIHIYINNKDITFIDGIIIDFIKNNFSKSFQFHNTKIQQFCGCGKSFNIF
ncbi:iron-sulfur cluster assembly accessory protein [Enterobacteriaceae endosymbiont of Donacia tomentosa]|uniref:iron-sulfur cluster assembly accessory protein n=1 Tax=Enterobacteriaceae endosymbiont of Donacia tomentosa TaxID=2675787 RepID=UPI0014498FBB|nr:iron-sulfur cluster assembly accessory protein [Enterobacteriaceae endosymbiont of Donacia tomentosa]QJC31784.1 iron-sulfur cluster assembly accessory protein [Enterobacteriaceae endosymbiont of Donacia tomentosa]